MELTPAFFAQVLQIIWIDLLLSGDNAVVIALACRNLPEHQRKVGIWLGAGAAVGLRIVFALIITWLLAVPLLKLIGGLLLLWIGVKLVMGEGEHEANIDGGDTMWKAVRTIAIADAVMSLDNVLAIAAASHGNVWLFVFGLVLSIPLIIMGSTLIMTIIERYPLFVWLGAALLGWIAGSMIVDDKVILNFLTAQGFNLSVPDGITAGVFKAAPALHYGASVVGALIVVAMGWFFRRNAKANPAH